MARKLTKYRKILRDYLTNYAQTRSRKHILYYVLFDEKRTHYQITRMNWQEGTVYSTIIFHFEIKEDAKIWIWVNHTELLIDEILIALGIAKQDICLGLYSTDLQKSRVA